MCGIAGIINKTPRTFDYGTFCTLGISNDARGGDSCGIFIDGIEDYGVVGDKKFFSGYFQNNELLDSVKTSTVALVHCRKASVGVISRETAQPVVLRNEKGKVEFVVMHNGTIYNYKELAKKYIPNIDIKGMTDSQIMARIFYYCGYDVLNEYNGGAVFAIVDYRNNTPKTFLFRGSSKKYSDSKDIEAERPLYFCIDTVKRELVFSSIWTYLLALRRHCTTYPLKCNVLFEFTGTTLVEVASYDRKGMIQTPKIVYTTYSGKSKKNHGGKYTEYLYGDDWDEADTCNILSEYISVNLIDNTYGFKRKNIFGKLEFSEYGKVNSKREKLHEVWFFNGVAMKDKSCFNFLVDLQKESKLPDAAFFSRFQNVIRFLSIDGVYKIGDTWFKAVSPTKYVVFSGVLNPLTASSYSRIINGVRMATEFATPRKTIKELLSSKCELNFKTIKEECESLMNIQEI